MYMMYTYMYTYIYNIGQAIRHQKDEHKKVVKIYIYKLDHCLIKCSSMRRCLSEFTIPLCPWKVGATLLTSHKRGDAHS